MNLRAEAFAGFKWVAGVRLLSQLFTWAVTLVVIRLLAPADYGLLAMATVFISFLAMFSELGLGAAIVQKGETDPLLLRRIFGVVLTIHFSIAGVVFVAAPLVATFYGEPRVSQVIQVLSLQFVLAALSVVPDAQLQRNLQFKKRALIEFTGTLLGSVTTLMLALLGGGVWALVIGSLLNQAWRVALTNWVARFFCWPTVSFAGLGRLLRFGGGLTVSQFFWMIFSQLDILICARLLGKDVLGFYSVAMNLAALPSQRLSGLINQIAFPTFSRMQEEPDRIGQNMLKGIGVIGVVAFPLMWGLSSVAAEVVDVVIGAKWLNSVVTLKIIALIIPVRMVGNFIQTAVQGLGRSDIVMRNAIWACIIALPAFYIGAELGGLVGLSLSWLIVSPLASSQGVIRILPVLGLRPQSIVSALLPSVGSSAVMYGAIVLAQVGMAQLGPAVRLPLLIVVGALAYLAASFVMNRAGLRQVIEMLGAIFSSRSK